MDVIDDKWLKEKLGDDRGAKSRLAEHLGLGTDKVSKMLNGTRKPQSGEVPKILEFFNESPVPEELQDIWSQLSKEDRQKLISVARSFHEIQD